MYEASIPFALHKKDDNKSSLVELADDKDVKEMSRSLTCCSLGLFPLAVKMMWNFGVGIPHICTCNDIQDVLKQLDGR